LRAPATTEIDHLGQPDQHLDPPADRGLGAVQGFRGAGKASEPGDRDEGLDLANGRAITTAEG